MDQKPEVMEPTKNMELSDEQQLAQLGHVQELRRDFNIWSLGSLCLCLMATWEALTSVVAAALTNGGAPCLFYNYIISFLATIAIAVSLSEIASIFPTAGGQYHWVAALAPKGSRSFASWLSGWISVGGQIVLTASAGFSAGLQFQGLVVLNNTNTYVPERWQGLLFYWLILAYAAAVNIWGSKILPHTNLVSGVLHIVGFLAIVIVFGIIAPKNSSEFVFVTVTNTSGWSSNGVSWLVGLLSTVYPFLGYDAACHLAEEMVRPGRNVPIAMIGSVVVNGLLGLVYCIILLYSITNLDDILSTATGFPFMQLFLNVTKNNVGATLLALPVSLIAVAASAAGLTSTSRTAWAFARDSGIPFSKYFSHVSPTRQIPVRMVVFITILQALLGFIYLGSSTAFNAVLSMAIIGMYASYLMPIVYMLLYGRRRISQPLVATVEETSSSETSEKHSSTVHNVASSPQAILPKGWFSLSRPMGIFLNIVSIAWLILAIVFSTFPSYMPVTPQNMNYSSVVMGGWMVFGLFYYYVMGGRKGYQAPTFSGLGDF